MLSMLNAQPGEKIMDFGSGSGELTVQLQSIVGESGLIVGVDAKQEYGHVSVCASWLARVYLLMIRHLIILLLDREGAQNGVMNCFVADVQSLKLPLRSGACDDIPTSFDFKFDRSIQQRCLALVQAIASWCNRKCSKSLEERWPIRC